MQEHNPIYHLSHTPVVKGSRIAKIIAHFRNKMLAKTMRTVMQVTLTLACILHEAHNKYRRIAALVSVGTGAKDALTEAYHAYQARGKDVARQLCARRTPDVVSLHYLHGNPRATCTVFAAITQVVNAHFVCVFLSW